MGEIIFLLIDLLLGIFLEQTIGFQYDDDLNDDDLDNL